MLRHLRNCFPLLLACLCHSGVILASDLPVRENFVGQAATVIRSVGEKHDIADILPIFGQALAERLPFGINQTFNDAGRRVWPVYDVEQLSLAKNRIALLNLPNTDSSTLWLTRNNQLVRWFRFEQEIPSYGLTRIGQGKQELALVQLVSTVTQGEHLLIINQLGQLASDLRTASKLNEIQFFPGQDGCLLDYYPRFFCLTSKGQVKEYQGARRQAAYRALLADRILAHLWDEQTPAPPARADGTDLPLLVGALREVYGTDWPAQLSLEPWRTRLCPFLANCPPAVPLQPPPPLHASPNNPKPASPASLSSESAEIAEAKRMFSEKLVRFMSTQHGMVTPTQFEDFFGPQTFHKKTSTDGTLETYTLAANPQFPMHAHLNYGKSGSHSITFAAAPNGFGLPGNRSCLPYQQFIDRLKSHDWKKIENVQYVITFSRWQHGNQQVLLHYLGDDLCSITFSQLKQE